MPEAIESLRAAGIKIWMLTGDKQVRGWRSVCVGGGGGGLATKPRANLLSDTRFVCSGNSH